MRLTTLLLPLALASAASAEAGRHVPAHDVPSPSTVSPAMRASIESFGYFDRTAADMPKTNAEWLAYSNPDPKATHERVSKLLDQFGLVMRSDVIAGVPCFIIEKKDHSSPKDRTLMHIHGGGYTAGAGESGVTEAVLVAGATGIRTISVDYRMPPEHPFPAPGDDALSVWKEVASWSPTSKLGLFGTSTGGAMVLSLTQRVIHDGLRKPDAIISGTPWSDLSETGDSYFTNRYVDPMAYHVALSVPAEQYANGLDLKDPRLSPVYGSFDSFPPTLLLSGTRDLFLSNTVRVDRKLRDAHVHSELIVYEGESHGQYLSGPDFPETQDYLRDVSDFFARFLK